MRDILKLVEKKAEGFLQTDIRYLASGGWWMGLGQGLSTLASFVLAVGYANLLPKEVYGTYKYVLSMLVLLSFPTLYGMTTAVLQSVAKGEPGAYLSGVREKLRWGSIGSVAAAAVAGYYAWNGNYTLAGAFAVAAPLIPFVEAYSIWGSFLGGKRLFKESTLINSVIQLMTTAAMLAVLYLTHNLVAIVGTYMASYALLRYIAHRYLLSCYPDAADQTPAPDAMIFGKKTSLIQALSMGASNLDSLILWQFLGPSALATYAFAQATTTPAKTFMKSLLNLATPKFAGKDTLDIKRTIHRKVLRSYLFFIPVTLAYILLLPLVYHIFFPQYLETIPYAQVLGLIFLFFPTKLYSIAITTREDKRPTYILNIVNPIMLAAMMAVFIPLFGLWGAVASTLMEYVLSTATTLYFFRKIETLNQKSV